MRLTTTETVVDVATGEADAREDGADVLRLLQQAARGSADTADIFLQAITRIDFHAREGAARGLSNAVRDQLILALADAAKALASVLPTSVERDDLGLGVFVIVRQIVIWAEGSGAAATMQADWMANVHAVARLYRNALDTHLVMRELRDREALRTSPVH